MSLNLKVLSATVPSPLDCVVNNVDWQALSALLTVSFPNDIGNFSIGNTEPPPSRRGDPWFRLEADGTPDGWYVYAMGSWLKRHTTVPGTVIMWEGLAADIDTFDGGEAGAVTDLSGPMWERVTEMDAKFPIGPGTLPSTAVIGVGDTGGEENHELVSAEIPKHNHKLANVDFAAPSPANPQLGAGDFLTFKGGRESGNSNFNYTLCGSATAPSLGVTSDIGGDGSGNTVAHNNLPPYNAIFFLRKTGRLFYRL